MVSVAVPAVMPVMLIGLVEPKLKVGRYWAPAGLEVTTGEPAPFARQLLTENLLSQRTPEVHQWAVEKFRSFRSEGQFVPFGVGKDTIIFPGFDGGAEWGGAAVDPHTGILY